MNIDHIYQLQRDEAFAKQFSSSEYQTFIAMPFSNRGGYPEQRIKNILLNEVHDRANALLGSTKRKRLFAPLHRVDGAGTASGSLVITDQIITDILSCHFFLGDLTGCNFGVVLETGVGLALKPNERVLLFTQDDTSSLHFDLKVTNVNHYTEDTLANRVAEALVAAANAFEKEADKYIRFLSSQLTPDAILLLNFYGQMWRNLVGINNPSIFAEKAAGNIAQFRGDGGRVAFHDCIRELSARRLMWTDYQPNTPRNSGADSFGIHATKLGWRLIEHIWSHNPDMREPKDAPTGPNIT